MAETERSAAETRVGIIKESVLKLAVSQFSSYEEYLDSMIIKTDLLYLEDLRLARLLVELGVINHTGSAIIPRNLFSGAQYKPPPSALKHRFSRAGPLMESTIVLEVDDPFMTALSEREEANRKKVMLTVIYVRALTRAGREVAAYIDFNHRLENDDFSAYWSGRRRLMPRPSDLSYVTWPRVGIANLRSTRGHSSANFTVMCGARGLALQCRLDGQTLYLHSKAAQPRCKIDVKDRSWLLQAELIDHTVNRGSA